MSAQAIRVRTPSAAYVGLRPSLFARFLALLGFLLWTALVAIADLASRLYDEMGRPNWSDVVGGVIFIPLSFSIVFSMMLGRGAIVHFAQILGLIQ